MVDTLIESSIVILVVLGLFRLTRWYELNTYRKEQRRRQEDIELVKRLTNRKES